MNSGAVFWFVLPFAIAIGFVGVRLLLAWLHGRKVDSSPVSLDDNLSSSFPYGAGPLNTCHSSATVDCGPSGSCGASDGGGCDGG